MMVAPPGGFSSGIRVAFDLGRGPTVLLCHGVGVTADYWRPLVEHLPDFRCMGLEFDPTCESELDLVQARALAVANFALELDGPVSLMGHSLGGAVVAMSAGVLGESVTHLVLEAPGGLGPELNPFAIAASRRTGIAISRVLYSRSIRRYVERRQHSIPPELHRLYRQLDSEVARQRLSMELRAARRYQRVVDAETLLATASRMAPLLIVWGERDLVLPVFQATRVVNKARDARLYVVPGAGHTPHVSHPALVGSVVSGFLRPVI